MARRLIESAKKTHFTVKLHKDTDWNEYRVTLVDNLSREIVSTYHTDDIEDARSTGLAILHDAETAQQAKIDAAKVSKPEPANSWKAVDVTIDAETLLDLLAAAARYQNTSEGESDEDLADFKAAGFTGLNRWMDAVRASGIA